MSWVNSAFVSLSGIMHDIFSFVIWWFDFFGTMFNIVKKILENAQDFYRDSLPVEQYIILIFLCIFLVFFLSFIFFGKPKKKPKKHQNKDITLKRVYRQPQTPEKHTNNTSNAFEFLKNTQMIKSSDETEKNRGKKRGNLFTIPGKYLKYSSGFMESKEFLNKWITRKEANKVTRGIKKRWGVSGCYLILIGDEGSNSKNIAERYKEVYAGQSLNISNRVYQHLTGHGNGDVYADLKYNRRVFVDLFPCSPKEMNDLERLLIDEFGGVYSYNRTAGGATNRG